MSQNIAVAEAEGSAAPESAPTAGHPRRWWILGALSLSLMVIGLDLTVLSVALPVLVADLKATTTELQWIMDSYILVLAALLLPAGSLGDRIGRKRVLVAGLGLFLAGSLLCAYAWSAGSLIGFRAFMGLGGAIVMPLTLSVLPAIFSEQERPKAIAVWSVASGISVALGPIVGGWLLGHYFWGSIFLFNVPFIAAAIVAVVWLVPESRDPQPRQADPAGALLATGGLTALVYAIIEQPTRGWDWVTLTTLTAGIALLAAFAAWEARSPGAQCRAVRQPPVHLGDRWLRPGRPGADRHHVPVHPVPAGRRGLPPLRRGAEDDPDGGGDACGRPGRQLAAPAYRRQGGHGRRVRSSRRQPRPVQHRVRAYRLRVRGVVPDADGCRPGDGDDPRPGRDHECHAAG